MGKTGRPALRSGRPTLPGRMIFLSSLLPADRYGRPLCLQSSLEISTDPCGRPLLSAELSGFLGRPTRSTVNRDSELTALFKSLSHFFTADPLLLSLKNLILFTPLKFLPDISSVPSILCWIFTFRDFLRQISRVFQI